MYEKGVQASAEKFVNKQRDNLGMSQKALKQYILTTLSAFTQQSEVSTCM